MRPLDDRDLQQVSGGDSQQDLLEFLERIERDTQRAFLEQGSGYGAL